MPTPPGRPGPVGAGCHRSANSSSASSPTPLPHRGVRPRRGSRAGRPVRPRRRLGRRPRAGVDELPHRVGVSSRACGDRRRRASSKTDSASCVQRLAVRRGELGAHDPVGGVLVLVALLELRLDAELVERAAQERRLDARRRACRARRRAAARSRRRRWPGRRRRCRRAVAEALGPGDGRLAARRERPHAAPQLLHRRPGQGTADLGDQPDDARVVRRPRAARAAVGRSWRATRRAAGPSGSSVPVVDRDIGQVELEQQGRSAAGQVHGPHRRHLLRQFLRRRPQSSCGSAMTRCVAALTRSGMTLAIASCALVITDAETTRRSPFSNAS